MKIIVVICILAALAVVGWCFESRRMRVFWTRACAGGRWRGRFPCASKMEIREYLRLFGGAFGFRKSRLLCFRPDDRVMEVYRTVYPPQWTLADSMELESFAKDVGKRYGVDLFRLWRDDITLGEVFALTRKDGAEPCAAPNSGPATQLGNSNVTEGPPSVKDYVNRDVLDGTGWERPSVVEGIIVHAIRENAGRRLRTRSTTKGNGRQIQ